MESIRLHKKGLVTMPGYVCTIALSLILTCVAVLGSSEAKQANQDRRIPESGAPQSSDTTKKLIPWIEVNRADMSMSKINPKARGAEARRTLLEHCLDGLKSWAKVTDTAIVTTIPGRTESLYKSLMKTKHRPTHIIGGLKTYILPGTRPEDHNAYNYADTKTWEHIAKKAKLIAEITGVNIVVLESETALEKFHTGRASIDFNDLRDALAPLRESGLTYWWWFPCVLENTLKAPGRHDKSIDLVNAVVEAVPHSVFITAYTGWHGWSKKPNEVKHRQEMIELVRKGRMLEMLYVREDGYIHYSPQKKKRCYTAEEVLDGADQRLGVAVLLYPGAAQWTTVAKQFATTSDTTSSDTKTTP